MHTFAPDNAKPVDVVMDKYKQITFLSLN